MMPSTEAKRFSVVTFFVTLVVATVVGLFLDFLALGLALAGAPNMARSLKVSAFLFGGLLFVAVGFLLLKRQRDLAMGFICGGAISVLAGGACVAMT